MKTGEGPVYFGLYAPDRDAVAVRLLKDLRVAARDDNGTFTFPSTSPLHSLFLGQRNKTSTDRPEYFAHPNSATRLSARWVRDSQQLREMLKICGSRSRRWALAEYSESLQEFGRHLLKGTYFLFLLIR